MSRSYDVNQACALVNQINKYAQIASGMHAVHAGVFSTASRNMNPKIVPGVIMIFAYNVT